MTTGSGEEATRDAEATTDTPADEQQVRFWRRGRLSSKSEGMAATTAAAGDETAKVLTAGSGRGATRVAAAAARGEARRVLTTGSGTEATRDAEAATDTPVDEQSVKFWKGGRLSSKSEGMAMATTAAGEEAIKVLTTGSGKGATRVAAAATAAARGEARKVLTTGSS